MFLRLLTGERKISPKFSDLSFFVDVCVACLCQMRVFPDLEGEVFGWMSLRTSGQKLPRWADFSFLIDSADWLVFAQLHVGESCPFAWRTHFGLCFPLLLFMLSRCFAVFKSNQFVSLSFRVLTIETVSFAPVRKLLIMSHDVCHDGAGLLSYIIWQLQLPDMLLMWLDERVTTLDDSIGSPLTLGSYRLVKFADLPMGALGISVLHNAFLIFMEGIVDISRVAPILAISEFQTNIGCRQPLGGRILALATCRQPSLIFICFGFLRRTSANAP